MRGKLKIGHVFAATAVLGFAAGLGFAIATPVKTAAATRNSSGTYALPTPGVPFQSNQTISSAQVNNTFNDLATELTDSLDRSGKGGMLAALRGIDGTVAAPAHSWTSETSSGLYRSGASDVRMAISGADVQKWLSTGATVTGTLGVSGTSTLTGLVGVGSAPSTYGIEINAGSDNTSNIAIQNTLMTGSPQLVMGMNNGNTAALFQITKASGAPSLGYKFFGLNAGTALNSFTLSATGVGQASGFKHQRFGATCTTAAAAGANCTSTLTWTTTFADANYTASCTCVGISAGAPTLIVSSQAAANVVVAVEALTAAAAQCGSVNCVALHD